MPNDRIILTQRYHAPCGELLLGACDGRLCLCDWTSGRRRAAVDRRLQRGLQALFREVTPEELSAADGLAAEGRDSAAVLQRAATQLDEYFAGRRQRFTLPLQFVGSMFQWAVWEQLQAIPYGTTLSYGELARRMGHPTAVRAVANANGANALSLFAPCHRVIGSDGTLTGYGGGLEVKRYLLRLEAAGGELF